MAVIDLVLPGVGGLELVRNLRREAHTARLPIIALTGRILPLGKEVAMAAGCDTFLEKPCLPDDLLGEVARLLVQSSRSKDRSPF